MRAASAARADVTRLRGDTWWWPGECGEACTAAFIKITSSVINDKYLIVSHPGPVWEGRTVTPVWWSIPPIQISSTTNKVLTIHYNIKHLLNSDDQRWAACPAPLPAWPPCAGPFLETRPSSLSSGLTPPPSGESRVKQKCPHNLDLPHQMSDTGSQAFLV